MGDKKDVYEKDGKLYERSNAIFVADRCLGNIETRSIWETGNLCSGEKVVIERNLFGPDRRYDISEKDIFTQKSTIKDDAGRSGTLKPNDLFSFDYASPDRAATLSRPGKPGSGGTARPSAGRSVSSSGGYDSSDYSSSGGYSSPSGQGLSTPIDLKSIKANIGWIGLALFIFFTIIPIAIDAMTGCTGTLSIFGLVFLAITIAILVGIDTIET